jgi:hypothetical protein
MPIKTEQSDGSVVINFNDESFDPAVGSSNLAVGMSDEELTAIGNKVFDDYQEDISSRAEWNLRRGNWHKLFASYRDPKSFPWKNCSNVGLPTITIAVMQFQARAFEALFGNKEIVRGRWTDRNKKNEAARVGKYMDYQVKEEMPEWEEDMDAMLMQLGIDGTSFKKTYYDRTKNRPVSRYLSVDDFVLPYRARTLDDAIRKTHIIRMYRDEMLDREKSGEFINVAGLPLGSIDQQRVEEIRGVVDDVDGITPNPMEDIMPSTLLEQHKRLDLKRDKVGTRCIITIDADTKNVLRIESAEYTPEGGASKVMEYFTQYTLIPNPEGVYGYGFGHLLEGLGESINSIINQLIDSGTLSNTISGLVSKRGGLRPGDLEFGMGVFKSVNASTDDIKKAIYQFQFNPPSNVLFALLGLLQEYANNVSTVSDSLLGKVPPSDTTATTMLAVLEQGLKVFSTIQRRVHRSLKKELKKLFILNSFHIVEEKYFEVQDSASEEFKTMTIGKADFASGIDVIPVSDPNITSKAERLIKIRQAWEFGQQNPIIMNDAEAMKKLTKEYLKALEMDDILSEERPPEDTTPQEENAGFITEQGAHVLPMQNHAEHYAAHEAFSMSEWATQLTPHGKKLMESHMRETLSARYMAEGESGGVEGVGAAAGDEGDLGGAPGGIGGPKAGGFPQGGEMGGGHGGEGQV